MTDAVLGQGKITEHDPLAHSEFFIDLTLNPIYHHSNLSTTIKLQNTCAHLIYQMHTMCTVLGTMPDAGTKNEYNVISAQKEFIVLERKQTCKQ